MTGIFKANNPTGNFILFIYALVLKFPMFMKLTDPALQPLDGILYKAMLEVMVPVVKFVPFIYSVLSFSLLFIQAIIINKIVSTLRLHKQPNYLTGMSYLLITSLFTDWFVFSAPLIVNTLLVWIWSRLCSLYSNTSAKSTIFNIGLVTGIASFIYFPSIVFLILVMVGIAIARPFKIQEWIIGLIGITAPIYFFLAFLYLTNKFQTYGFPGFHFSLPHFFGNKWAYASLVIILITTIIGMYFINANINRQVVQTRKSWQLLFLYLVVAMLVPFFNAAINFSYWILLAVPLSPIIAATFFYPTKKTFPLILHWSMFALFIIMNFIVK